MDSIEPRKRLYWFHLWNIRALVKVDPFFWICPLDEDELHVMIALATKEVTGPTERRQSQPKLESRLNDYSKKEAFGDLETMAKLHNYYNKKGRERIKRIQEELAERLNLEFHHSIIWDYSGVSNL
uniref:Uncharacterized protein n=1 Tax=Caenorhabditis tropicalis TaxID=1561998 RepID=A0A1I7T1E1_9PELO